MRLLTPPQRHGKQASRVGHAKTSVLWPSCFRWVGGQVLTRCWGRADGLSTAVHTGPSVGGDAVGAMAHYTIEPGNAGSHTKERLHVTPSGSHECGACTPVPTHGHPRGPGPDWDVTTKRPLKYFDKFWCGVTSSCCHGVRAHCTGTESVGGAQAMTL